MYPRLRMPLLDGAVIPCPATTAQRSSARHAAPPVEGFRVEETTIAQIHEAMKAGRLTCRALVDTYLRRIHAYDKNGPALNALVVDQPRRAEAGRRPRPPIRARRPHRSAALHPHDRQGQLRDDRAAERRRVARRCAGFVSNKDAFQVKRIKDAGAIVLAKSNMAEFAFSPYETVNSILPGYTPNPYALDRVTAGSSGGTAAAVAANLGAIGLGSDTGNSIRGPSAHQALAGIRSTMGLTSRAGVIPLSLLADIAGPDDAQRWPTPSPCSR